jgi:fatty acid amide hydrolase 2
LNPLLQASATELAARIRSGERTSREVVDAHIARIEAINPVINAVVAERFAEARAEADAADARVRAGDRDLPPLHGVPFTVKECFALTGMPNTSGLVARKAYRPARDATVVTRLRKAGAIPLGVTNTSELCMWMETYNRVYGRTKNPYDPRRIVGGSSGGEGAIVGAGGSPFGVGSDVGGSIRMPAFFNGVFGHKPTGGLVPGTGQHPMVPPGAANMLATGPIARKAEDLAPLLRIMAGPDGEDGGCRAMAIGDPATVDLGSLRVIDVPDNGLVRPSAELRAAQERVVERLRARGARVVQRTFPHLRESIQIWGAALDALGGPSFAEMLGEGVPVRGRHTFPRWFLRRSPHTLPALGLLLLERIPELMPNEGKRLAEAARTLRAEVEDALGDDGVLLYPSYPRTAPRHRAPLFPPIGFAYTAILNVLELPVTQVPLGLDRRGVPLGVQVAARHANDHMTIAVAMDLEKAMGGWVAPPR